MTRAAHNLLAMPQPVALAAVAAWLDDCDTRRASQPQATLPDPPFDLLEATVVLRIASGEKPYTGPVRPSALALLARITDSANPRGMPVKGGPDWWALKALVGEGLAQIVGVVGQYRKPKLFVIATGRGQAVRKLHA